MNGSEKRRAPRNRVLLEGRVAFNNRSSLIGCTVRDVSTTGAKVVFPGATLLPAEVQFEIPSRQQSFRARVMWSDGKAHGLMFIDEAGRPLAPPEATSPSAGTSASEIQAVVDEARHQIARLAGVSPEAVRLKLEIDY